MMLKLESVHAQVVTGVRYVLKFYALHSHCTVLEVGSKLIKIINGQELGPEEGAALMDCYRPRVESKRYLYTVEVWEQSWKNIFHVMVTSVEYTGTVFEPWPYK